MPDRNTEIVRRIIDRTNDGRLDEALRDVAPDATLDWSSSEGPDGGIYRGQEGWREWISGRSLDLVDARFDVVELLDAPPDSVVLVAYMRGRGRLSGLEIEALGAAVWTLAGGRVTGLKMHQTRDEAVRAAGLLP